MPDVEEYAETVLAEIRKDQAAGVVPVTVRTFSELHDYVDANVYVIDVLAPHYPPGDESAEMLQGDAYYDVSDAVMDRVDAMLREVRGFRCPCCGDDVMGILPVCAECVDAGCEGRLSRVERDPGYWACQRTDTDPE